MTGPAPKPTHLKTIEGHRSTRINKQEPDPEYVTDLAPPDWLPREAKRIWKDIAPKLRGARMLTVVDTEMLAQGCCSIMQYRHAVKQAGARLVIQPSAAVADQDVEAAEGDGEGTQGDRGGVKVADADEVKGACLNPWLIVQSMAFKQCMKVFTEFGMSPSSRTRLAIQPQQDLFGSESAKRYFGNS